MMKRISALVLILAFALTSVVCVPASADTAAVDADKTAEIRFLEGIGILDNEFSVNIPVTRGIYAKYVARMNGNVPTSDSAAATYIDVSAGSAVCDGISLLTSIGLLNGYGDGTFRPDRPVTLNEAVKVMIDMLGYKYRATLNGGYPNGYMIAAQELGLLKGLDLQQQYFYGDNFARLIYNALDVDVLMENGVIKTDDETSVTMQAVDGRTLLSEKMDMYRGEGVIEANSVTNLSGAVINNKQLWLDGLAVTVENPAYWQMVGCYVEYVYYQPDDKKERVLVYAAVEDENSVLTLSNEEFISLDGLRLQYSDESGKVKKASLSGEVDFVYNGDVVTFNQDYLDNFNVGVIKLIDNTGDGDYDVFMIEDYISFVVDSVNTSQMKVDSSVEQGISLVLNPDSYSVMHILNSDGTEASFENVSEGNTISYFVNGSYLKAYLSKNIAEGVIESISTDGGNKQYSVSGRLYTEPDGYSAGTADVGDGVTVYIDVFGYISDIEMGFNDSLTAGFMLKGARINDGLNTGYGFKIYTSKDKVLIVYAADKVYYNGVSTKIEELPESLAQSIICYKLNDDGLLSTLETPVPRDENYVDGRLMTIYPKTADTPYYSSMLDSKVVFDTTTTMFSMPDIEGEITENMINAITKSAMEDREAYTIEGYAISAEAPRLKALIMYGDVTDGIPRGENLATLVKLSQELDDNGMEVYKADVMVEGVEKSFNISDDVTGVASPTDFKPGDCFRYATNSEGEIHMVDRMYTVADGWIPDSYEYFPVEGITETVMHFGEVLDNDGAYLRVKFDDTPYSGFIQDYYAIPMSHYTAATVVTIGSRGCTVTKGKIQDAAKGDEIINYRNLMAAVGFVIIKHE